MPGGGYTCALRADGRVFCWGDNTFGQLGIGSSGGFQVTPKAVRTTTGLTNAVALGAGGAHACAVRSDGAVFCWGANDLGQIGIGRIGGLQLEPVEVPSFRFNIAPRCP